jgi:hypothetical protein
MQYRLSTIFLIFFVAATTLALFGTRGIWVAGILCLMALCLNRTKSLYDGVSYSILIVFIGLICPGFILLPESVSREPARMANCRNNMQQIGLALCNYNDAKRHFPPVNACDKEGKPLRSWLVQILPYLEYDEIYNSLNKDEPWDSSGNAKVLPRVISEFTCPSAVHDNKDFSSNYIAIIGQGTIWKAKGTKTVADLPHGTANAIAAVEAVDAGKHWAEPLALTVDEVLESMKAGKGARIASYHPGVVHVLFVDGTVRALPAEMPLSLWRKILDGEVTDFKDIESQIDRDALSWVNASIALSASKPGRIAFVLSIVVWLISVIWLDYRAIKSRKKPETETVMQ